MKSLNGGKGDDWKLSNKFRILNIYSDFVSQNFRKCFYMFFPEFFGDVKFKFPEEFWVVPSLISCLKPIQMLKNLKFEEITINIESFKSRKRWNGVI